MRWGYRKREGSERTDGQRALRKRLAENPREFVAQLVRLEEAHAKKVAAGKAKEQAEAASDVLPMDDGTARVLGLLDELLGKCREERGPGGAGPDALVLGDPPGRHPGAAEGNGGL